MDPDLLEKIESVDLNKHKEKININREDFKLLIDKRLLIEIIQGDITQERSDAVVNAANSHLRHGGGLAGAIVRSGGQVIQKVSD